ncbi:MAG: response regulator [Candidatus Riflebacteria bacterium]|nr:response regulator [Candidatus Riflebacteria bacterium]
MSNLKSKILIIDDLPANIQVLAKLLGEDYEINFATSGTEGIEIASRELPDLILLDVMMPGMDGFETCTKIKKNPLLKGIPIIFVTALGEEINETHGLEAGAIDYIVKPINPVIVKAKIKNHLELEMIRLELKEKNRELESFCAAVAHDLRAPLRSVAGIAKIVAEDCSEKLDKTNHEFLEKICLRCNRMEDLVSNLLRFSFISASELKRTKFNLSTMAEEICSNLKETSHQIPSEISILPEMEAVGDSELIRVVMTNLLNNAWKFTAKREKRVIHVSHTQKTGRKTFFVKDNGAGFEMKYAKNMFGVFQRLHSQQEFEGNGLGLFISHRIIQKHDGKIWAESEQNKGATFYFELP